MTETRTEKDRMLHHFLKHESEEMVMIDTFLRAICQFYNSRKFFYYVVPLVGSLLVGCASDLDQDKELAPQKASLKPGTTTVPTLQPGDTFSDCENCPIMVLIPSGTLQMGTPPGRIVGHEDESPQHLVRIAKPFAVSIYEVTFAEWDNCVADGGCNLYRPNDRRWGRGTRPLMNVSWDDASSFVSWLRRRAGFPYRLLSEAEWEYVARAGSQTKYHWGDRYNRYLVVRGYTTQPVGSYPPNDFGLYDVHGNVWEWTMDCWNSSYYGAPADGSAWLTGDCGRRVIRGGSWYMEAWYVRSAFRSSNLTGVRDSSIGFRIARDLLLLVADAKADELFVAHSRDTPSRLWADLDATVEETQRDGRVSIFKIHKHRRVVGAADGRFFNCTVLLLAKQRGYVNFSNAEPIDGRHVVIFLKEHDEDVQGLIDSEYREYEFFERVDAEGFALLEQLCVTATSQ